MSCLVHLRELNLTYGPPFGLMTHRLMANHPSWVQVRTLSQELMSHFLSTPTPSEPRTPLRAPPIALPSLKLEGHAVCRSKKASPFLITPVDNPIGAGSVAGFHAEPQGPEAILQEEEKTRSPSSESLQRCPYTILQKRTATRLD